jgi:hypothetical protein
LTWLCESGLRRDIGSEDNSFLDGRPSKERGETQERSWCLEVSRRRKSIKKKKKKKLGRNSLRSVETSERREPCCERKRRNHCKPF